MDKFQADGLESSQKLVNHWIDTEINIWKSWMDLMGTTINSSMNSSMNSPVENPNPNVFEQYSRQISSYQQSVLNNQETFLKFLQTLSQAWTEISPLAASGSSWEKVLETYMKQLETMPMGLFFDEKNKIYEDTNQLWQIYLQSLQKLGWIWPEFSQWLSKVAVKEEMANPSSWLELSDLYWNVYEKTFGGFLLSPTVGASREFNHKVLEGFNYWVEFYRAGFDYQVILNGVRNRSFSEFMKVSSELQNKGESVKTWRQLLQLWSEVFDRIYMKTFEDSEMLKIRGNFINSAMRYKRQEQSLVEVFLKMYAQPLRSEVDEVHKRIYELNKEVKALKKNIAKLEAEKAG